MPKSRLCGVWERMAILGIYIASMGSPSGRCNNFVRTRAALGTCGQVARVWMVLLTVRPVVAARVRTQSGPVRTIGLHSRPDSNGDRPDAPH
jgi:hypothetical protein